MVTVRDVSEAAVTTKVTSSIATVFNEAVGEKSVPVSVAVWPSTIGSGEILVMWGVGSVGGSAFMGLSLLPHALA
jgi:hypothetical protein